VIKLHTAAISSRVNDFWAAEVCAFSRVCNPFTVGIFFADTFDYKSLTSEIIVTPGHPSMALSGERS
jgi:hypothetical protein